MKELSAQRALTGSLVSRPWMALVAIGDTKAPSCGEVYPCSHTWSLEQGLGREP